jgi:hypothetical protein
MQKGGNKCSLLVPMKIGTRCSRDTFSKSSLKKNIVAFRLVGYFTWNEEVAGSNPVYYTNPVSGCKP